MLYDSEILKLFTNQSKVIKPTKVFIDVAKAYKDGFWTIGLKGSARSSKTVSIVQFLHFILTSSSKHRKASIVSQSFPHLRDGAIYEYEKFQARENIVVKHQSSRHEFSVRNSIINYFSVDDPTKAVGPDRDICYANEMNNGITFDTYTNLKVRTKELFVFDYNPSAEWFLSDPNSGILDDPKTIILNSTWLDNLDNLTESQIQYFLNAKKKSKSSDYWRYWWEVYGLGKDAVLLEERIMPFIKLCSSIPKDAIQIPNGLDFGFFPDPTAFIRLWVKPGLLKDDLYIEEVVYDYRLSINSKSDGASNLLDRLKTKGVNSSHLTIAESADPKAIEEMRGAKYNVEAVRKTSVETSIRVFHDYNIHVLDNSLNTYKELNSYKFKRNRKGVILPIPADGQSDHSIDSIRYVLMSRNTRWSIKK